jgi:WD40 repeat protein
MRHDAFISYSHSDSALAREFEHGLERLAKPLLRLRALDVFRDQTGLAASAALWRSIVEHLSISDWFLLMCSPQSAASAWCNKEIEWWLANRTPDRILILLTDGDLVWNSEARDFDSSRTTALPLALRAKFSEEPLFTDLRWARDQAELGLANPRFRDAVLNVASPLRGVSKDELDGVDVRQLRRNRLFVRSLVTTIAVAAVLAAWQWYEATQERDAAREQARIATSRKLVADSRLPGNALDFTFLISAEAYQVAPTRDAHENLIRLVHENERVQQFLYGHEANVAALTFSPDGARLASMDDDGRIILWDKTGESFKFVFLRNKLSVPKGAKYAETLTFNESADRLFATYFGGQSEAFVLGREGAHSVVLGECLGGKDARIAVSADGSKAAVRTEDGTLTLWELKADLCSSAMQMQKRSSRAFALSATGSRLTDVDRQGRLRWWDIDGRSGQVVPPSDIGGALAARVLLDSEGKAIAAAGEHTIGLWTLSPGGRTELAFAHQYEAAPVAFAFGPSGDQLAVGLTDGAVDLWRWSRGKPTREQLRGHAYGFHVSDVAFNHDGSLLATAAEDGLVMLWYLGFDGADKPLGRELGGAGSPIEAIAFDKHNRLAAASADRVILWNAAVTRDMPILTRARGETEFSSYYDPSTGIRLSVSGFTLTEADKNGCGLVRTVQSIAGHSLTDKVTEDLLGTLEYAPTCKDKQR